MTDTVTNFGKLVSVTQNSHGIEIMNDKMDTRFRVNKFGTDDLDDIEALIGKNVKISCWQGGQFQDRYFNKIIEDTTSQRRPGKKERYADRTQKLKEHYGEDFRHLLIRDKTILVVDAHKHPGQALARRCGIDMSRRNRLEVKIMKHIHGNVFEATSEHKTFRIPVAHESRGLTLLTAIHPEHDEWDKAVSYTHLTLPTNREV